MTEINLCPLQGLSEGGPLQPVYVGKLSTVVNGDRLKNLPEQNRPVFPFDTVQRLYNAFRGPVLYPHNDFPAGQSLIKTNRTFDPSFLL
nr:hypothetical protein [uncultured Oscillibacter sp.]